ncbi:MAG: hypothetical protein H0T79_22950 [Deltaproteobacteria bacterium]|nr:hypothetical protein [Deltaproteobacteria bacterium]
MKAFAYAGAPLATRSHPWTDAASDPTARYYDLKAEPAKIRTALEDFLPWRHTAGVEAFYELLEWLNGASSILESNDCELSGPHANETAIEAGLEVSGRVMVLFRELPRNLVLRELEHLNAALHHALARRDPAFTLGAIGTTITATRYITLSGSEAAQLGSQLMVSFWAWGDSEVEVMANFARVVRNLSAAFRGLDVLRRPG